MARLAALLVTTAWARSPLEMLCDGDRLIVVAGYHHSGTSILQAQLARRLGLPVPTTTDERWPTDHHEEACSPEWSVFRTRLSGLRDVHRFARLRNRFPAARLVFCTRDAPNQIWSLMRRACAESPRLATYLAKQRCQVLEKEARWRRPGARDWTVDLADFAVDSRSILQQVVPGHLASPDAPSLFIESAAVRVPSFAAHDGLRRWQVRQPVYAYERNRFAREGGALVPLLRSLGDCARVRAMPPLSLGERKALSRNNCSGGGRAKFPADLLFPSVRRPRGGY